MENLEHKLDLKELSKPIEIKTNSQKGLFDSIVDFFKSKPEINILSTSPKPIDKKAEDNIKIDHDQTKNHSQTSDSSMAHDFFKAQDGKSNTGHIKEAADIKKLKEQTNPWFGPNKQADFEDSDQTKPVSILWLVGGALLIVIVIVMILGSFGLVNLVKVGFENNSLSDAKQAIKQTTEYLTSDNLDLALSTIDTLIENEPENQEAIALQKKIYSLQGAKIIDTIGEYKNLPAVDDSFMPIQDPHHHFTVSVPSEFKPMDSAYDLKYSNNNLNLGVKKYPRINSITALDNAYLQDFSGKDYLVMDTKSETTFLESNAIIHVVKIDNMYQYSILMQKYHFGYEISAWMPTTNYQSGLPIIQNFIKSFILSNEYNITGYQNLESFGNDQITIYNWPNTLSPEQKNEITAGLKSSVDYINLHLNKQYQDKLNVYLYPDFDTLYQYTLSNNSFSDYRQKSMHIVYTNAENHQSFGYETTKIIYQSLFGEITEPLVINGVAVWLDQTGRDYVEIVKNSDYIALSDLFGVNWELNQSDLKYHEAGIFTGYLIDKYGLDQYIQLSSLKDFPDAYQTVYGKSLTLLESEFKTTNKIEN